MDSDSLSRSSISDSYDSDSGSYSSDEIVTDKPMGSSVVELEIKNLQLELADNPSHALAWKKQVELVSLLRKNNNIVEARKTRTTMADSHPLEEKLWLEWLEDEQEKAQTEDEQDYVTGLYKRAVEDYISVEIWVKRVDWEYTLLLERNTPTSADFDKIRSLYETAIVSCGLHFTQGHKLWKAFVDFEKMLLEEVKIKGEEKTTSLHVGKIRNLYKRVCALPLKYLEEMIKDYEAWEASLGDSKQQCQLSNAAVNQAKEKLAFEEKLSDTTPHNDLGDIDYTQLDDWKKYIQAEEEKNEPVPRIKCLYERAIRNYHLISDLWKNYLSFLEKVQSTNLRLVVPQLERALRNVPSSYFWVTYMLLLEKLGPDMDEVTKVFTRSYSDNSGVTLEEDFIVTFEVYFDIKLRHVKASASIIDPQLLIEEYRQLCQWCLSSVSYFPLLCTKIMHHWAHVETYIFRGNVEKIVEIYDDLLAKNSKDFDLWQDAINSLIFMNDIEKCRNFFKRAVNSVLVAERQEVLFNQWVIFERINGTAETLSFCNERFQKWKDSENEKRKIEEAARLKEEESMKKLQRKRKIPANEAQGTFDRLLKAQKLDSTSSTKEKEKTEFKAPLPMSRETPQTISTSSKVNLPKEKQVIKPEVEKKPEEVQSMNVESEGEKKLVKEKEEKEEKEESNAMDEDGEAPKKKFDDKMTVFFNNVPFKATEEDIKEFLSSSGAPVKEVRLVLDKISKKSKGFGYADFETAEDRQKCIDYCNGKKYPNSQAKVKVEISKPPVVAKPAFNPYLVHTEKPRGGRSFNNNRPPNNNSNRGGRSFMNKNDRG